MSKFKERLSRPSFGHILYGTLGPSLVLPTYFREFSLSELPTKGSERCPRTYGLDLLFIPDENELRPGSLTGPCQPFHLRSRHHSRFV